MTLKFIVACCILVNLLALARAQEPILIVTEDLPPLQIVEHGRVIDGLAYQKVKRLVDSAKLEVNWLVVPWSRAYQLALTQPNILLFSVVRTPERENLFTWIGQLLVMDLFLVSHKSRDIKASTLEEAKQFLVGAKHSDVVFEYLAAEGFIADKNMIVVSDTTYTYKVLLKGRVDLVPANKTMIEAYCTNADCTLEDFRFNIPLPDMQQDFYLAASKGTDPKVIKALSDAYHSLEAN